MFNRHLFKVIMGFCAMILVGLVSLIIINSLAGGGTQTAQKTPDMNQPKYSVVTLPPIKKRP